MPIFLYTWELVLNLTKKCADQPIDTEKYVKSDHFSGSNGQEKRSNEEIDSCEIDIENNILPMGLINSGQICYMISIIQCLYACYSYKKLILGNNILENLINAMYTKNDTEKSKEEFLNEYFKVFNDVNESIQFDSKVFFLRLLSNFKSKLMNEFIINKTVSVKCEVYTHEHVTPDTIGLCNFTRISEFSSVHDKYFNKSQEGNYYCIKCKKNTLCTITDQYKFSNFIVYYFSNADENHSVDYICDLVLEKNQKVLGIIERFGISNDFGHYIAHTKLENTWYTFNDSNFIILNTYEKIYPYMIFCTFD